MNHGTEEKIVARRFCGLNARAVPFGSCGRVTHQPDRAGINRRAQQQALRRLLGLFGGAPDVQPVGAFGDEETPNGHDHRWDDGAGIHPAPGVQVRVGDQNEIADGGAAKRANGLERECREHQLASAGAGDTFRNDHVRGGIVAAKRHPEPEQTDDQRDEVGAEHQRHQEGAEDDHLDDEHALAAERIRHSAEADGADQNPGQAGSTDQAVLG
jgi:hypothetical protein